MTYCWSPFASEYDPVRCGSIDGTDVIPHDRAIVRAMSVDYRPNKGVVGDPKCTLFVGRLNKSTSESTIEAEFTVYAPVRRVRLVRDVVTGTSRGYAFVEFFDERTTKDVCREAAGMELDDRQLLVELECERTLSGWVPRRLGGGFGGRKEAGQLRFGGHDRPFRKPIIVHPPNRSETQHSDAGVGVAVVDFKWQHSQETKYDRRHTPQSMCRDDSRYSRGTKRRAAGDEYERYDSSQSRQRRDLYDDTNRQRHYEK